MHGTLCVMANNLKATSEVGLVRSVLQLYQMAGSIDDRLKKIDFYLWLFSSVSHHSLMVKCHFFQYQKESHYLFTNCNSSKKIIYNIIHLEVIEKSV